MNSPTELETLNTYFFVNMPSRKNLRCKKMCCNFAVDLKCASFISICFDDLCTGHIVNNRFNS